MTIPNINSSSENLKEKTNDKTLRDPSMGYTDSDSVNHSLIAPYAVSVQNNQKTHQELYTQGTIIKDSLKGYGDEQ